jgi:hypothetical protein
LPTQSGIASVPLLKSFGKTYVPLPEYESPVKYPEDIA